MYIMFYESYSCFSSQNKYINEIWVDSDSGVIEIHGDSEQEVRAFIEHSPSALPPSAYRILEGNPIVFMNGDRALENRMGAEYGTAIGAVKTSDLMRCENNFTQLCFNGCPVSNSSVGFLVQDKNTRVFYVLTVAHLLNNGLKPGIDWDNHHGGFKSTGITYFLKYRDSKSKYDHYLKLSNQAVGYYGLWNGKEVDVLAIKVEKARSLADIYNFNKINNLPVSEALLKESTYADADSEVFKQSRNYEAVQRGVVDRIKYRRASFPTLTTMLKMKDMTSSEGCSGSVVYSQTSDNKVTFHGIFHSSIPAKNFTFATDVVSAVQTIEAQLNTKLEIVFGDRSQVFSRNNQRRRSALAPSEPANTQVQADQFSRGLPASDGDHAACGRCFTTILKENLPVYDQQVPDPAANGCSAL